MKKLFSKSRQLQITINTSEDFELLKNETGEAYLKRLKKAVNEVEKKKNLVTVSDSELHELMQSKENQLLYKMSNSSFANAWAEDEPEYSLNDIKTVNPDYDRR